MAERRSDNQSGTLYEVPGQFKEDGVWYLPSTPRDHLQRIKSYPMTSQDLLVATFSKSGTTWTQEIVYLIQNGADVEEAKRRPLNQRVPFLDNSGSWSLVQELKSPKILKTHLQSNYFRKQIFDDKVKVVVMMRNPKDTLVSFYNFYKNSQIFGPFPGDWDDFFELVKNNKLIYGDWFQFTLSWWKLRKEPNVLILKYEDMKLNAAENITKLAQFMDRTLTDEELHRIVRATSFETMKANRTASSDKAVLMIPGKSFMRKGQIGDWRNYFNKQQNEYFNEWYAREMNDSGLDFMFEADI